MITNPIGDLQTMNEQDTGQHGVLRGVIRLQYQEHGLGSEALAPSQSFWTREMEERLRHPCLFDVLSKMYHNGVPFPVLYKNCDHTFDLALIPYHFSPPFNCEMSFASIVVGDSFYTVDMQCV